MADFPTSTSLLDLGTTPSLVQLYKCIDGLRDKMNAILAGSTVVKDGDDIVRELRDYVQLRHTFKIPAQPSDVEDFMLHMVPMASALMLLKARPESADLLPSVTDIYTSPLDWQSPNPSPSITPTPSPDQKAQSGKGARSKASQSKPVTSQKQPPVDDDLSAEGHDPNADVSGDDHLSGRRCITPRLGKDPTVDPAYCTAIVLATHMKGAIDEYHRSHMDYLLGLMHAKIDPARKAIAALDVAHDAFINDPRSTLLEVAASDLRCFISAIQSILLQRSWKPQRGQFDAEYPEVFNSLNQQFEDNYDYAGEDDEYEDQDSVIDGQEYVRTSDKDKDSATGGHALHTSPGLSRQGRIHPRRICHQLSPTGLGGTLWVPA